MATIRGKDYIGVGCGAVIQNEEGKVLLMLRGPQVRNEKGTWSIPGGGVDFGETRAEAIQREVKEELDCEIRVLREIITVDHIIPTENQHWVTTHFICKVVSGHPKITEPDKCERIDWFSLKDMPKLPLASHMLNLIEALQAVT